MPTAINEFFNSWWMALNAANTLASETINGIVNMIAPPEHTNVGTFELLTALASSFAFLDVPGASAFNNIGKITSFLMEFALTAVQQTPNVLKALFPEGTITPATYQIGEVGAELANLVMTFQTCVSNTVNAIETNQTAFTIWAETGAFCGPMPSLDNQKGQLFQTLNTFIISRAYNANSIVATVGLDTDVVQLQQNSSQSLSYDIGCPHYDQYGVCNAWWHDNATNSAYSLDDHNKMSRNFNSDMETIFSNNWTTGELLFGGAQKCKGTSGYQQPPSVAFNTQTGFTTSCISTLTVCTWNLNCELSTTCEFLDCPTQDSFATDGCSHPDNYIYTINVPYGYLGPYLTEATAMTGICNDSPVPQRR